MDGPAATPRAARPGLLSILGFALAFGGCFNNPGVDPPPKTLNFPLALALAPASEDGSAPPFLYVANSNFDLRFNSGSVQTLDLRALEQCMFGDPSCQTEDDCVVVPDGQGGDQGDALARRECSGLMPGEVWIGSYAADMELAPEADRLYIPVRSDVNLTYLDVNPDSGELSCGGEPGTLHRCEESFRRGDEAVANDRSIEMPSDPSGVHVGRIEDLPAPDGEPSDDASGDFILLSHRGGLASLFFDRFEGDAVAPQLVDTLGNLPPELAGIELNPSSMLGWLPSTTQARIGRVGVARDPARIERSFLFGAGSLGIRGLDTGGSGMGDTRDIAFDPRPGVDRAYVLSRSPESLLFVDLGETGPGQLSIEDVVDVCAGPSRLEVTTLPIGEGDGTTSQGLAFVSCFESRELFVIDLKRRRLAGVVRGMSGPFEVAIDEARSRVYVADFRQSVIRVVDLTPLEGCLRQGALEPQQCSPRVVGTVGRPRPVEELR